MVKILFTIKQVTVTIKACDS
ncbi:MAG: hypothetical protein FD167_4229, partial [bacterium]